MRNPKFARPQAKEKPQGEGASVKLLVSLQHDRLLSLLVLGITFTDRAHEGFCGHLRSAYTESRAAAWLTQNGAGTLRAGSYSMS